MDLARSSLDQRQRNYLPVRWSCLAIEAGKEHLCGCAAEFSRVLRHHGQAGVHDVSEFNVVEADLGDAVVEIEFV